jgi:hypothetical protein
MILSQETYPPVLVIINNKKTSAGAVLHPQEINPVLINDKEQDCQPSGVYIQENERPYDYKN